MFYSKIQKTVAFLLLFFYFFNISISIPMLNFKVFAEEKAFYDLVSIIVDDEIYPRIEQELKRYSRDISSVLENTKVIILPIPKNTRAFNIASINESLYFEGYKGFNKEIDFNSKLVGTIFIGDIDLPTIFNDGDYKRTVLPYTDFVNKYYIYNKEKEKYEENAKNYSKIEPEIWHSFISPNTGNFEENIKSLKIFFDKDHNFYVGKGKYKQSTAVINGKLDDKLDEDYKPYVFYFDYFREIKGLNEDYYGMYKSYLDNKEDLKYSKYSKELAKKLEKDTLGKSKKEIVNLINKLDPSINVSKYLKKSTPLDDAFDIQAKYSIESTKKIFLEIFSKEIIGKFREDVHNAGRYNYDGGVNMDFIPYLISLVDSTGDEILKDSNNQMENLVDKIVDELPNLDDLIIPEKAIIIENFCNEKLFENYIYGRKVETMKTAIDCNINRGSLENGGKVIEANRGYNIYKTDPDFQKLKSIGEGCLNKNAIESGASLEGLWGKNSPLYLDSSKKFEFKGQTNYERAIVPLFDIKGGKEKGKAPIQSECEDYRLLLTRHKSCSSTVYALPEYGPVNWDCFTLNNEPQDYKVLALPTFEELKSDLGTGPCHKKTLFLDGKKYSSGGGEGFNVDCDNVVEEKLYYKSIRSPIHHKFPTSEDLTKQVESKVSPSLGIDKNRYIDFIQDGKYKRFDYPFFFRIKNNEKEKVTLESSKKSKDYYLDKKSDEINKITGGNIDLKGELQGKPSQIAPAPGYEKEIKQDDMMDFSVFWNNLDISAKYSFIFEKYLSEDFESNMFFLPKAKKAYEIAYLGSSGKPDAMYIGLDLRTKKEGPYSEIFSKNKKLASKVFSSNVGLTDGGSSSGLANLESSSVFECGSPDGVPIWEWMPAIKCWLSNLLPPTIEIYSNECSSNYILDDDSSSIDGPDFGLKKHCFDENNDGINDCIYDISSIDLSTSGDKYNLNSNVDLKAKLKGKNGENINYIDSISLNFDIVKVEKKKDKNLEFFPGNTEVIFDKGNNTKNNPKLYDPYLTFKTLDVKLIKGEANYGFSSKGEELNVYLKVISNIKDSSGKKVSSIESNIVKVQIRKNKLFSIIHKIKNGEKLNYILEDSLEVSDKTNLFLFDSYNSDKQKVLEKIKTSSDANEKLIVDFRNISNDGNFTKMSYPLNFKLYLGKKLVQDLKVSSKSEFIGLEPISKSGIYSLEIKDSFGFKTKRDITFTSIKPDSIKFNLGSNMILSGHGTSTSAITLLDKYGNVSDGKFYKVELSIDGDSLVFWDSGKKIFNFGTFEGYKIFRLRSNNNFGNNEIVAKVFDNSGKQLISSKSNIKVLEDIKIDIEKKVFNVGNNNYKLELRLKDKNGNLLQNFSSRVYFGNNSNYIKTSKPYFEIKNGKTEVEFETKTLAGKSIPIEIQIEGINSIKYHNIDILPEKPIKVDLIIKNPEIEANGKTYSNVTAKLKDRYDNLVFTDSTTNLEIEIHNENSHIITTKNKNIKFLDGEVEFQINSTKIPGLGFFKVSTEPSLSNNSFIIKDKSKTLEVKGVGENSGEIKTVYFWNKEKIKNMHYNTLYTTLIGSNYGDIDQKDYLAGALIFDKNSRALAVTSIIDLPYKKNKSFFVGESGNIYNTVSSLDIDQDLTYKLLFDEKKFSVDVYNESLGHGIGKIYYNFPEKTDLYVCSEDCNFKGKSAIFGKSFDIDYNFYIDGDKLYFSDKDGNVYFSVSKNGEIDRRDKLNFEVDIKNEENFLKINLNRGNLNIGYIGFSFKDSELIVGDKSVSENMKDNNIVLKIENNFYYYYYSSDKKGERVNVYYNDPFSSKKELDSFSKSNIYGYENFVKKSGIGWQEGNRTLLSFAAGNIVGDAVKNSFSFGVINIGDPVISLKKIRRNFNSSNDKKQFDSTIGKIISTNEDVQRYELFDYNGDNRDDILLIKKDDYLSLLENRKTGSEFVDMGNLVYLDDIGSYDLVKTGDFTGDSFEDIFFISKKGIPYLINNIEKRFTRVNISKQFNLDGKIVRMEVFDMDADGKDDIITLDDNGEINIFYGAGISQKPLFTKKNISKDFALKLSEKPRSDNSLAYFDSLYQVKPAGTIALSDVYNSKSGKNNFKSNINRSIIESMMFEQIPYTKSGSLVYNGAFSGQKISGNSNSSNQTTFIKGEYAEGVGLKIEKVFKDLNGGNFKSGDEIEVNIKLTNTTNKTLKNIVYLEKLENYFTLKKGSITNNLNKKPSPSIGNYDFLIDSFSLLPNETFKIKYNVLTSPIKYSYMKVGLFESGEPGDDIYGDIIVQDTYKNCGKEIDLFRSTDIRKYEKGKKFTKCKENSNKVDTNSDGVPDKIEEILGNPEENIPFYAEKEIAKMDRDSDKDGKTDDDDMFTLENGKLVTDLTHITDNAEEGLEKVEEIVDGLSCGFSNGACMSTPLNWAPLAPGNDPVFMGKPIGDGFKIDEGIPVFSALTRMYYGSFCGPTIWPISPFKKGCSDRGAGGYLGVDSNTNFFRLFVTPTLTGGVGMAACFGATARQWGSIPPKKISPLMPGGNCIVVAKPLLGCSDDGSDGDPASIGIPISAGVSGEGFSYISGNCGNSESIKKSLSKEYVKKFNSQGGSSVGISDILGASDVKDAVVDHSVYDGQPLVTIGPDSGTEVTISLDDIKSTDYSDIEKLVERRIKAFPEFLMEWVSRQIEEIIMKLTDFLTITIILPNFEGLIDTEKSWKENRDNWFKNSGNSERLRGNVFSVNGIPNSYIKTGAKKINSGIKETYKFLGSIPFVKVEQEPIFINIPSFGDQDLERIKASRKHTLYLREVQLERAKEYRRVNGFTEAAGEIEAQVYKIIDRVKKNLEIIGTYTKISKKIKNLINKKQEYLEQILCNINSVLDMTGGRIGENGERFKSWVELYILIKSVLKSWQVIVEIFEDYEASCGECKNERRDTLDRQFLIISMIVPSIPVVEFPKMPDINIDLHNIRFGAVVKLPQFNIESNPILLPDLPDIILPYNLNVDLDLTLPDIPILPELEIPELPDFPSLPIVDLPNLPPPPKLPELFAGFEFITDIAKLVTKAMCILKKSPFVPEWRAGDQIAFLTERNGFLPIDFLSDSLPKFSFPFVDSIDVTSYVNLEYETDFIVEMARQIAAPMNIFTGDFTNKLDIDGPTINLRDKIPSDIDVDLKNNEVNGKIGLEEYILKTVAKNIMIAQKHLVLNSKKTIKNDKFKKKVLKSLSSDRLSKEPKFSKIKNIWDNTINYNFSKEDELIEELKENNRKKINALKDIINTEIIKTKKLEENINKILKDSKIKVSFVEDNYNEYLKKYNDSSFKNVYDFIEGKNRKNSMKKDLKNTREELLLDVKSALSKYNKSSPKYLTFNNKSSETIIADNYKVKINPEKRHSLKSCGVGNFTGNGNYVYEGIYILEKGKSYRLFAHVNELKGDEEIKTTDFDGDGDQDIFYFANNILYLKKNLSEETKEKLYLGEEAIIVKAEDNKFLNNSKFLEAINDPRESVSSTFINIDFTGIKDIYNYRLSYYNMIDKHFREDEEERDYVKMKNIVDGVAGIDKVNLIKEEDNFYLKNNIVWIDKIGNFKNLDVYTEELKGIKEDILNGNAVFVSNKTSIYTGNSMFKFKYIVNSEDDINTYLVPPNSSIELKSSIKIVEISSGDGYIKTNNKKHYKGKDILKIKGLPLFSSSKIVYDGGLNELKKNSYLEIKYYDESLLSIDFRKIYSYEFYSLGQIGESYLFPIEREESFYYAIINGFNRELISTSSKVALSSPQISSDQNGPEISIENIKVPVYKEKKLDITNKIFEDSGLEFLKDAYVDFNLEKDSNFDGILTNDRDSDNMENLSISIKDGRVILSIGKFDKLISKKIGVSVLDGNGNIGYKEVDFEVYSPEPSINNYEKDLISGKISEDLDGEPINIYRYRGGNLAKIYDESSNMRTLTNSGGTYEFKLKNTDKNLSLKFSGRDIVEIDELTGKINILNLNKSLYKIKVEHSDDLYPKIIIEDSQGKAIFYQKFNLNNISGVKLIEDYSEIKEKGLYVNIFDKLKYNYYILPQNISYNAGSLVLYKSGDKSKKPLFIVFKDGRIWLAPNYKLSYSSFGDYMSLKVNDLRGKTLFSIIYNLNGEYVLK